ncbi:MAG: DUF3276 family protein [Candidatus Sumerlaeia bacterium]|nr:DUF3276 family protein [Candidatus Sumerlaeia bacterium]
MEDYGDEQPAPAGEFERFGGANRQERRELFSRQVRAGRRTYYLDVKENARKDKYLVISESRRNQEGTHERTNIMVFEEDMGNFKDAFEDVCRFIKNARMPPGV